MNSHTEPELIQIAEKLQRNSIFFSFWEKNIFKCKLEEFGTGDLLPIEDVALKKFWSSLEDIETEFILGVLSVDLFFDNDCEEQDELRISYLCHVGFCEGLIVGLRAQHKESNAHRFCLRFATLFEKSPAYFMYWKRHAGVSARLELDKFATPFAALANDYSIRSLEGVPTFYALKIISCLFPMAKKEFFACLEKIASIPLLHEGILFSLCQTAFVDKTFPPADLFRFFPSAADPSLRWNGSLLSLSLLYSLRGLLQHAIESKNSDVENLITATIKIELPKRDDFIFLVLSFGGYLIHELRGNIDGEHKSNAQAWRRCNVSFLEIFRSIYPRDVFCSLAEIASVFGEEISKEKNDSAIQTGIIAKKDSLLLLALLVALYIQGKFEEDESKSLLEASLLANSTILSYDFNADDVPSAVNWAIGDMLSDMPDGHMYWHHLRNQVLVQLFYRHRFCYLKESSLETQYLLSFFLKTSIALIVFFIEAEKYKEARDIFTTCWNDYANMLTLSNPHTVSKFEGAVQYLFVIKVKYLSDPLNNWNNTELLDTIYNTEISNSCIKSLKNNSIDFEKIKRLDPDLYTRIIALN